MWNRDEKNNNRAYCIVTCSTSINHITIPIVAKMAFAITNITFNYAMPINVASRNEGSQALPNRSERIKKD